MTKIIRLAAILVAFLLATPAWAASEGWHPDNIYCNGATDSSPSLLPGKVASWCPSTTPTLTAYVRVRDMADCNWDGEPADSTAGSVTLTVYKCVGSALAGNCDTPMVDSAGDPWSVVSDSANARFSLTSGIYLITASGTTATGRLLCTGR